MAVQAQQYSSPNTFPDFRTRAPGIALDELHTHHHQQQIEDLLIGTYTHLAGQQGLNGAVLSEPESELTCNASGSRKRTREQATAMLPHQPNHTSQQFGRLTGLPKISEKTMSPIPPMMSAGPQLSSNPSRLHGSTGTSTSGRPLMSPLARDFITLLYHQSLEIDALVRLQNERLRAGMEDAQKRQGRALVEAVEQTAAKRLREKEAELQSASRRNVELEERVRQVSAETQIWFTVARNNEAIVSSLRGSLEQALLHNTPQNVSGQPREGFGDSEGALFPADDAQSCCFEERKEEPVAEAARENAELRRRRVCRSCGQREVCVLVLPCRHLCLCKDCEPPLDTCPVCKSPKNASLQVFMA